MTALWNNYDSSKTPHQHVKTTVEIKIFNLNNSDTACTQTKLACYEHCLKIMTIDQHLFFKTIYLTIGLLIVKDTQKVSVL